MSNIPQWAMDAAREMMEQDLFAGAIRGYLNRAATIIAAHAPQPDADALVKALESVRRSHYANAGDCWYSCPKSDNCCDPSEHECNCGADKVNAIIDTAVATYRAKEHANANHK